ncbi:MAG: hypothetical protein QM478_06545 [Flavobacteriaceae bacterium]
MKKLLFLPIFFMMIFFNSCQEEGIEIVQENGQEAIVANSTVASLISRTATLDGSNDNILDGASCINIQLPVTVFVNGLEIIVDSEEDFEVIEAIFDELDDDDDSIDIVFPIVIVLSNYDEIVIENQDQLEEFIASCSNENEEDDDIECVDFIYPLTYTIFDTDDNVISTVTINSDEDMYHFIQEIDENDIIALNFPVTLEFSDGEQVTANSVQELEDILESAVDFCDEDDDNDYCDDDFTLEQLNELLVTCPWVVHTIRRNDQDATEVYAQYVLLFEEDGVVRARRRNGEIVAGTWETQETDNGVVINLSFDAIGDFTLTWNVCELGDNRIKLYVPNPNGNVVDHIVLIKNCDIVFDHNIDRIENILKECFWRVHRLRVDGIDHEEQYIGTPLKFEDNNIVKLRINGEFVQGTWEIIEAGSGFALQMSFDNRPNLNLSWLITELENDEIKLENQNSEMRLRRVCPDTDDDIVYINQTLIEGTWMVAYFEEDAVDNTANFNNFALDFLDSRRVHVIGNSQDFGGSWMSYRNDDDHLKLALNFMDHDIFYELNNRWKIIEINATRIELVDFSSTGAIEKKLVLERN